MDVIDPLETSTENEDSDNKVILNHNIKFIDEHSMESDEDQRVVDHLSPQTLLETPPDNEVQYSFRSHEGTITYRVLQVEDGVESIPQIVTAGSNFPTAGVQPVLTSNLNGQVYVINPTDVFATQAGTRAIAPRSGVVDGATTVPSNLKKRDERRRVTHNEVERRRRDKINSWITRLSKIIPDGAGSEMKGNGHYDGQSKGGILAKACEYIVELKDDHAKLDVCEKENKKLTQCLEMVRRENLALERENRALKDILKQSGIEIPTNLVS